MAPITRKPGKKPSEIIVQNIDIRQVVRTTQDISTWRSAMQSAENITWPRRGKLYDLYFDILLDGHLSAVIEKRKLAVTNTPVNFTKDGEEVEDLMVLIKSPWFSKMLSDILDARFWGHTAIEFTSVLNEKMAYSLIPRKHVVSEKGIIVKTENAQDGWNYREAPISNYVLEAGESNDLGLLLKAAQYVIYKRNGFADYSQFCELFGIPMRIGKYDPYNNDDRLSLQNALDNAGSALALTIPKGAEIEIKETGNTTGGNTLYSTFIETCNKEISKLILGQTLTTEQGDKGARSLGEVHMEVEDQIHADDRLYLKNWLNYTFRNFLQIHGFNVDGEFDFVEAESVDLSKRILIDMQVSKLVPVDPDYFYETYGLTKPKNAGQATKVGNQPQDPKVKESTEAKNRLQKVFNSLKSFF